MKYRTPTWFGRRRHPSWLLGGLEKPGVDEEKLEMGRLVSFRRAAESNTAWEVPGLSLYNAQPRAVPTLPARFFFFWGGGSSCAKCKNNKEEKNRMFCNKEVGVAFFSCHSNRLAVHFNFSFSFHVFTFFCSFPLNFYIDSTFLMVVGQISNMVTI